MVSLLVSKRVPDAEDYAQDILVRAWRAGVFDLPERPDAYWMQAVMRQWFTVGRRRKLHDPPGWRSFTDPAIICGPDWRDVFLANVDPWLISYYQRKGKTKAEHIRAHRMRERLKEAT